VYTYRDISSVFNLGKLARYKDDYDLDAIKNSLRNIFVVQKNEVPGKPNFGNPLNRDTFDLFDNISESVLFSAIENAIEKYEPRVRIVDLKIHLSPEFNRIIIDLRYEAIMADETITDNLLIPFSHNNFTYLNGRRIEEFTHSTNRGNPSYSPERISDGFSPYNVTKGQ